MPNASPKTSEYLTRKQIVDAKLQTAGWKISRFDPDRPLTAFDRCAIEEFPTENGPADYALCVGGEILGVVEAKKLTLGPQEVLPQAERYSRGLTPSRFNFDGFHVPFLYSTNGEIIWHRDVRGALNRSRQIAAFHTPDALREFLARDADDAARVLAALPNNHPHLRPYQFEANTAIEQAIESRKRQMLVAMATGTGKTFTMVNEVYRLMKSGVAKRILFLVDRRALAAQAVRAFASFEPEPNKKFDKIYEVYSQRFHKEDFEESEKFDPKVLPNSYLTEPKPGHAFVYVSTIQRMDFRAMTEAGSGLGSAGFIVYDDTACIVAAALALSRYLYVESCNQCPPCKFGSGEITPHLEQLENGRGSAFEMETALGRTHVVARGNRCALPVGERVMIQTVIARFENEFRAALSRALPSAAKRSDTQNRQLRPGAPSVHLG